MPLQRVIGTVLLFAVLHKDIVPYFNVLTAAATRATFGAARRLSRVDEHFRVGTARTGFPCGPPPVILAG